MTLTNSEPAEVSRRNGGKNRRARTGAGRKAAGPGNFQHGLQAKTVALPNEAKAVAERAEQWHHHYNPQSPAAIHYTNESARATVHADRAENYLQATLEKQVDEADALWRVRRQRQVADNRRKLPSQPAAGVAGLMKTGLGVRYLIGQYEALREIALERGYLLPGECADTLRLLGVDPTRPEEVGESVLAYMINLYNLGCTPGTRAEVLEAMVAPANRPEEMREMAHDEVYAAPGEASWEQLMAAIDYRLELLHEAEEKLRTGADATSRKRMLDGASVLKDAALRRYTRAHSETRISYDRSYKGMLDALDRDADELEAETETQPETESPVVTAATAEAPFLPIEPGTEAGEPQQTVEEPRSSGAVEAPVGESSFERRAPSGEAPRGAVVPVVAGSREVVDGAAEGVESQGPSVLPIEPGMAAGEPRQTVEEPRSSGDEQAPEGESSFERRALRAEAPHGPEGIGISGPRDPLFDPGGLELRSMPILE